MMIATTGTAQMGGDFLVYHGPYREIIPRMAAAGYKGLEMHIFDSAEIDRTELWNILKKYNMVLTSIGTGSVYGRLHYNLGDFDPAVRKAAIRHLEQHMITAEPDHGVVIIGLIAGRYSDCKGDGEQFRKNLTESLYYLDELAQRHDVHLGFEIMNRFESDYLTRIEDGVEFLKKQTYKRILLHLDTVHMNIEEADIYKAIISARGYVGHVHVADNDRWYPGHGHYNFRETLMALSDIGYEGTLALETNNKPSEDESARRGLAFLKEILSTVQRI
ncbi:MAG: sugar phosphate isomerase/epimerase [Clostridium sp.]|nr:sugar phosphate isomerase/epimerase [Clostridium sp.]